VREVQNFHPASRGDSQNSQNRPISNRSHGRDHDLKAARNWARSRACKPLVSKTVTRRQGVSRVRIPPPPLSSRKRLQEARIQIRDQLSMRPVRLASDAEAPRISCLSPNEPIARRSRGCGWPGVQECCFSRKAEACGLLPPARGFEGNRAASTGSRPGRSAIR
jgi:hypothetical protein